MAAIAKRVSCGAFRRRVSRQVLPGQQMRETGAVRSLRCSAVIVVAAGALDGACCAQACNQAGNIAVFARAHHRMVRLVGGGKLQAHIGVRFNPGCCGGSLIRAA